MPVTCSFGRNAVGMLQSTAEHDLRVGEPGRHVRGEFHPRALCPKGQAPSAELSLAQNEPRLFHPGGLFYGREICNVTIFQAPNVGK